MKFIQPQKSLLLLVPISAAPFRPPYLYSSVKVPKWLLTFYRMSSPASIASDPDLSHSPSNLVLPHFSGHIVKGNANLFELSRSAIAQGGMKPLAIVKDFHELEDVHPGLVLGGIGLAMDALTLQGGIEACSHRVVAAVIDAPGLALIPCSAS